MPILECEGVFEVVVPEGWSASGNPGISYELAPDSGDIGITISVFDPKSLPSRDASELVVMFVASVTGSDARTVALTPADSPEQSRSFARFVHDDRAWFAGFLLFPGGAVLASSNVAAGDDEAFAIGERIVASIAPVDRKRSWFGVRR